jgi:DNA transformation protein
VVLEDLRNLGPASAAWLREAGVATVDDLERLGSVEAFLRVSEARPEASVNLLYALEGALIDVRWDLLPPDVRADLRRRAGR